MVKNNTINTTTEAKNTNIAAENEHSLQTIDVEIKLLDHYQGLPLPAYQTEQASGMDLLAAVDAEGLLLPSGAYCLIATGICLQLPNGWEGQVRPRSGLAVKHGVTVLNAPGTIDADYRGEIKVALINHGQEDFLVTRGMRIAQLVICSFVQAHLQVVADLDHTPRGEGGFGHTGA